MDILPNLSFLFPFLDKKDLSEITHITDNECFIIQCTSWHKNRKLDSRFVKMVGTYKLSYGFV